MHAIRHCHVCSHMQQEDTVLGKVQQQGDMGSIPQLAASWRAETQPSISQS